MTYSLGRALIFSGLAILTIALAYLYQRRERKQQLKGVWMWPALFSLLALRSMFAQLPGDPELALWLGVAFVLGLPIGIARGLLFKMRAGDRPGTFHIMATPLSGALYLVVLIFNEFQHVFRHGDPNLGRISCALLVLTAGNSIAVNVTRVVRYRRGLAKTAHRA